MKNMLDKRIVLGLKTKGYSTKQIHNWFENYRKVRRRKLLILSESQNHRCAYCNEKTWHPAFGEKGSKKKIATMEHLKCVSEGGTDHFYNVVMACAGCNNNRASMYSPEEYFFLVSTNRKKFKQERNMKMIQKKEEYSKTRYNKSVIILAYYLHFFNITADMV